MTLNPQPSNESENVVSDYDFQDLRLDHVKFYVGTVENASADLAAQYGFCAPAQRAHSEGWGTDPGSVLVGSGDIHLVLAEPSPTDSRGRAYVETHGDGVADIAIAVPDVDRTFTEAVRRGARPITAPAERDGVISAAVAGFGDVVHTLVQRDRPLQSLPAADGEPTGLRQIDHFAVCVNAGELESIVEYYQSALGFAMIFEEHITVGEQAMNSKVVQSPSGTITFTILEPDTRKSPGQIDDFLDQHGGPGVQHIAFTTDDIVSSTSRLTDRGVEFLTSPRSYYDALSNRIPRLDHAVEDLRKRSILVDADHGGQLYQIFARSQHPRRTFFYEVIERDGAEGFGSGNIKALYEAVEVERMGATASNGRVA